MLERKWGWLGVVTVAPEDGEEKRPERQGARPVAPPALRLGSGAGRDGVVFF